MIRSVVITSIAGATGPTAPFYVGDLEDLIFQESESAFFAGGAEVVALEGSDDNVAWFTILSALGTSNGSPVGGAPYRVRSENSTASGANGRDLACPRMRWVRLNTTTDDGTGINDVTLTVMGRRNA